MSEKDLNQIIAFNISNFLDRSGKTQVDLAEYMGVSQATVSNWCKGVKMPRMDKIDKICSYFDVLRSDLMEDHSADADYYTNKETARLAQEAFEDPDTRILLDAKRDLSPEDMQFVIDMVKRLKGGS